MNNGSILIQKNTTRFADGTPGYDVFIDGVKVLENATVKQCKAFILQLEEDEI